MAAAELQFAAKQAYDLLELYSPEKPRRLPTARSDTADVQLLHPERTIKEALAEAQFILNQTSNNALRRRMSALTSLRKRQRVINGLHLLSGSGFILLIANRIPDLAKWIGAIVSLSAGLVGLVLPTNMHTLEAEVTGDINSVSNLAGEIAHLQTKLLLEPDLTKGTVAMEIASVIQKCMELARKYELHTVAAEFGFYPRSLDQRARK